MKKLSLILLIICLQCSLFSQNTQEYEPYYAGTLLSYYAVNAAPGEISIQPYVFLSRTYGIYKPNWSLQSQKYIDRAELSLILETGITSFLDVGASFNTVYGHSGSSNSVRYADMQLYFGLQLLLDKRGTWQPDLRLVLLENFPTGQYQKLDPNKYGTQIAGFGSYQTSIVLVTRKIFYTFPHPFNFCLNLIYILSTSTDVKGLSVYGGDINTRGVVKPGDQFIANLGMEFSFTQNWAVGMDIHYTHLNKSVFHKRRSTSSVAGLPSSEVFSLAPCLEYNYSENFSLAGGVWFTVAGRNGLAFASGVFNVFYYF